MAEKRAEAGLREERALTRREPFLDSGSPFRILERFSDEMDRIFDDFGLGRARWTPRIGRSLLRSPSRGIATDWEAWTPEIEMLHRNNELVIRADLPGLTREDVKVDVTDDGVAIQGERKREHEEEREGVYRSERSYGSFYRMIPLPEGAMTDQAKATFKDGVLEITMPAPPEQVTSGRRLEITEGASVKK
jgi:HSP20 family protein